MLSVVDEPLRRDARAFELRFRCEDCAHFDPSTGRCAEGYPNEQHRRVALESVTTLSFCKSFELT